MKRNQDDTEHLINMLSLGAGAGAGAARLGRNLNELSISDKAKQLRVKDILPGDVIFEHGPDSVTTLADIMDRPAPKSFHGIGLSTKGTSAAISGSPYMHASVYKGRGKTIEAKGDGFKTGLTDLNSRPHGNQLEAEIYRHVKPEIASAAVKNAKGAIGAKYGSNVDLLKYAADNVLGTNFGGKPSTKYLNKCKGNLCTNIVADSFPESFSKRNIARHDILNSPEFKLIGKLGHRKLNKAELVGSLLVNPALQALKFSAITKILGEGGTALKEAFSG